MRFAPGLTLTSAPRLTPRGPGGRVVPDGLLTKPAARLDDLSPWVLDPDWSDAGGKVVKAPSSVKRNVTCDVAIPAGDIWVAYTQKDASAGSLSVQLLDPFQASPFSNGIAAQHVARFTGSGFGKVRLTANNAFDGALEDVQVVDMTSLLAQPSDIYIAAGQSLIAAEAQSGPVDPDLDYWVKRCLYMPGNTSGTYGTVVGEVAAATGPLQMRQTSHGVSPALSFAREIEKSTAAGRTVLILACAEGGSRIVGSDAEWNPAGTVGDGRSLYAQMLASAQVALARTPGSQIKGLLWGQGESDRSLVMDTSYPPAFAAMVAQLRSDLALPALPVILLGPMPDDTAPEQPLFLQTQARLDQDSGHPTAIPGVHYVARPTGYMSGDGTHPVPEGNRIAGRLAAARFLSEGYL
ncbi:sialate O-acetylesterase [Oceanibium sediminis]|uniref:sialate O-acetylesterase n=1 Tax=Oceanibium sediminis TaxID=2026339 RepID=UPI000DD2B756|nr:sialate O-acetylesterase [Oceanibium sediminis]